MESKDLLELAQRHNIDIKNQLSSVDPEQRDLLVELVRKGETARQHAATAKTATAVLPEAHKPIRILETRRPTPGTQPRQPEPQVVVPPAAPEPEAAPAAETPAPKPAVPVETPAAVAPPPVAPAAEQKPTVVPVTPATVTPPPPVVPAKVPEVPAAKKTPEVQPPPAQQPPVKPLEVAAVRPPEQPAAAKGSEPPRPQTPAAQTPPPPAQTPPPQRGPTTQPPLGNRQAGPMRNLGGARTPGPNPSPKNRPVINRTGNPTYQHPKPPPKPQPKPEEQKKPAPTGPRKIGEIPAEFMKGDNKPLRFEDLLKPPPRPTGTPAAPAVPEVPDDTDDDGRGDKKKRPGGVPGRDQRHKDRNAKAKDRDTGTSRRGGNLLVDEVDRPGTAARIKKRKQKIEGTVARKGKVPIELPITVRSLSAAMGLQAGKLLKLLLDHGAPPTININSPLDAELAEALALEQGCELDVKRPVDLEEQVTSAAEKPDNPEDLQPRAPVVTIMGHVDHGKTSLLDKIRKSNVVDTEAGGITQSIRAWRVEHNGKPITFLDTPGHEAFTKMRARGANVTDIAVIVVAADDGVMPQTEEAISHAKAAEVAIVVALNKVDLPNANIKKAESQLYGLGLLPDNMGGDVPFVYTSAATGKGIDELLEAIQLVADLQVEPKANPNKPGRGTCLEASVSEGEGVFATLLVQDGTLKRGDVVLCGASYGRVRAMYDDLGRHIESAGPSVPARITGLDEIPNADDPFVVVDSLATAREIAGNRKDKLAAGAVPTRGPMTLERFNEIKVVELKVILKADVRGSVEAIRKELEKLHHEEVRVRVLHTGIGAINESDVTLALTSPRDTIIVGFNVTPDDRALTLAEERGVQIREYQIIYKLTDDIRAALEGKLKPREEVVHLGRAVVREVFKISRVGTIAGCYVTQGTIERSALVRMIRGGVVIYPPPERTAGLDSLKRFKEDVREVQQGYECGIKVSGYDDIKVDDVIEAYRIQKVQRTLS